MHKGQIAINALLVILVFLSISALAAEQGAALSSGKVATVSDPAAMVAKIVGGLLLVLFLIGVFAYLAKRLGYGGIATQKTQMQVIGSLPVGTREKAVLVEVNGVKMLLGVAPGRVNNLHVFEENPSAQEAGIAEEQVTEKTKQAKFLRNTVSDIINSQENVQANIQKEHGGLESSTSALEEEKEKRKKEHIIRYDFASYLKQVLVNGPGRS